MEDKVVSKMKYNYGKPINLNDIQIEDTTLAIREFANGSRGLEICLRVMWQYGLKTYSSNPGNSNMFDVAYITMEKDEDLFSYLSERTINDDAIRLDIVDDRQLIEFSGNDGEKNSEMINLAQDIVTGRKYNNKLLKEKVGKPFPDGWVRTLQFYDSNKDLLHWSKKVFIKRK